MSKVLVFGSLNLDYVYRVPHILRGRSVREALRMAARAASIAVSRPGAVPSIPTLDEVL